MPLSFSLGDLTIHRLVEQEGRFMPALEMFPTLTAELLEENRSWLAPRAIDPDGTLLLAVQSYIVRTPHHTVLIDSCVGNDKPRSRPNWNMRSDQTYLQGLAALGMMVDDIDFVLCTHLHVDHVGWNTRLENGRWVPTFPKARYQFSTVEFEHWRRVHADNPIPHFGDSVLPVVEAGKVDFVTNDHALGDHVRLLPTPGHTPGHVAITLGKGRDHAVVTGDLMHTPLQTRYPELSPRFDVDGVQAGKTRRAFLERYCDTDTLCCTAHFPSPSVGYIKRWGEGFRCAMVE
jgi:glyoxylase-like metal-dependent hydrolase (beta-lactamase superfamily II)